MNESRKLTKIKSSVFSRGLSLAKLTLNTGAGLAGHGLSTLLSDKDKKDLKWQEFIKAQAGDLSAELGELKGSLMKAGQMLSMYGEHFLPPEANQLLKSLQSDSPAVEFAEIQKILNVQLSNEQRAQLDIESEPIGTASLGQVHRAAVKGESKSLALKIQYPGVDKAIDADLKAIRSVLSLLKLLPKNLNTDHLFSEVREMLQQETDYKVEIQETIAYQKRLTGDDRYIVPQVDARFCGEKVIASSYEKGLRVDDPLIQSLSLERRNKIAHAFLDLYFKELFNWGIVQTDPHLGNYRVRLSPIGKDQLVLFDFGAIRKYPEDFLQAYHSMIRASLLKDDKALNEAALKLKFIHPDDPPELVELFKSFCLQTVEPFRGGVYDFKNSDLPQRLTKLAFKIMQSFPLRPPPREVLFLDRKTGGVFIFLSVLGAKMDASELISSYLLPKTELGAKKTETTP